MKMRNAHWMSIYIYEDNEGGPMSVQLEMTIQRFNEEIRGFVDLFNKEHGTEVVIDCDWERDSYPASEDDDPSLPKEK